MFWWCGLLLWIISILQASHFDRKGGFFPLSTPSSSYLCACVFFPTCVQCSSKCCCFHQKALFFLSTSSSYLYVCFLHLCAVLFQVLLLPPVFPFHLIILPVCVFSLPVCSAVPSAAASTCFSFPPHHLLTCMCVFFTCVQCSSKCCCFHQKALFFPFHPIVFLPVCVFPPTCVQCCSECCCAASRCWRWHATTSSPPPWSSNPWPPPRPPGAGWPLTTPTTSRMWNSLLSSSRSVRRCFLCVFFKIPLTELGRLGLCWTGHVYLSVHPSVCISWLVQKMWTAVPFVTKLFVVVCVCASACAFWGLIHTKKENVLFCVVMLKTHTSAR